MTYPWFGAYLYRDSVQARWWDTSEPNGGL